MGRGSSIPRFLADTWWYGLTSRIDERNFKKLAKTRVKQGFDAVQLVVGIPPEVGVSNKNALSVVGGAWDIQGNFNDKYLSFAKRRIKFLNKIGLKVIIYGAWGHQIEWLGLPKMILWWQKIVESLDDLDVIYCITGESDLWIGKEKCLLPDKTTSNYQAGIHYRKYLGIFFKLLKKTYSRLNNFFYKNKVKQRMNKWSKVLSEVYKITKKPILIHTSPNISSLGAVYNFNKLNAVTVQTGHDYASRDSLWKLPIKHKRDKFINLEPWYEGILGQFGEKDQLFAYWSSMMSGAWAYCYGAHGIWNVGDGEFLCQWGGQSFERAMNLQTPSLLGISHKLFIDKIAKYTKVRVVKRRSELISIERKGTEGAKVIYVPNITKVTKLPKGKIFLPDKGVFVKSVGDIKNSAIIFLDKG